MHSLTVSSAGLLVLLLRLCITHMLLGHVVIGVILYTSIRILMYTTEKDMAGNIYYYIMMMSSSTHDKILTWTTGAALVAY